MKHFRLLTHTHLLKGCLMAAVLLTALWSSMPAKAQSAFRLHRNDGFYVLRQDTADIVFLGNSITNLHNWSEAFGDARIQNRGISAAFSWELENNLAAYLRGKPRKIFLMIGTNDLGQNSGRTPAQTATALKSIINYITGYCPNSHLYVQSILPSTSGGRTLAMIESVNNQISTYIDELHNDSVTFIDLTEALLPVATNADGYSYDNLHLTGKAYAAWCHQIEPYIGLQTVYKPAADVPNLNGGMSGAIGMRTTVFGGLPVKNTDVLILGDEVVHSGEWWELLNNTSVKNRGWGWGYANTSLDELKNMLDPIFHDQGQPAKVFIYAGTQNLNNGTVDAALTKYKDIVQNIRTRCPNTGIYLMAVLPNNTAATNTQKYAPFNDSLRAYAARTDSVTFIDTYTPLLGSDGAANTDYISGNWVQGRGYARIAQTIAPYIPGSSAVSEEEAVSIYNANKQAAYDIFRPQASTTGQEHLYTFYSSLRRNLYMTEAGNVVYGGTSATDSAAVWKFIAREDNSYDIINLGSGHYLSPVANYNAQISTTAARPASGWTVKNAATNGMFVISSGTVELNQTQLSGYPVYNWSTNQTGNDLTDTGCQTAIRQAFPTYNSLNSNDDSAADDATRTAQHETVSNDVWIPHRVSALMALPAHKQNDIVFIGNSITNLHDWQDAFPTASVHNRGVSGAISDEVFTNLPAYLDGQPGKVFLMIGTNDLRLLSLNSPKYVARSVISIINRIVDTCPQTQLYVQSILPTNVGRRTTANISAVNAMVKAYIDSINDVNVKYIDLSQLLAGAVNARSAYSLDGLHLTAKGYSVWCHEIEKYVGVPTSYPTEDKITAHNIPGNVNYLSMRCDMSAALPRLQDSDIVMMGDELICNGEWKELLGNRNIKNRAADWWYGMISLDDMLAMVPNILHDGATPRQLFLYAGTKELNSGTVANALSKYKSVVSAIRTQSPNTAVYLMGVIPNGNASTNTQKYIPFNDSLRAYAAANDGITYIDTYTPFVLNGAANSLYITNNLLYGRGYARMANILANYIDGCTPVDEQETANLIATRLNAMQSALRPKATTDTEEHSYTLCTSLRNYRFLRESDNLTLYGENFSESKKIRWQFVERTDGTYDIINAATGHYISPTANYNAQISTTATRPDAGWTIRDADTPGMFILNSGNVELNQTNLSGLPVYNWSTKKDGLDTSDTGCQFFIREFYTPSATLTGLNSATTDSTAADFISNDRGNGFVYDISGRKISNAAHNLPSGLYIQNGKKFVVK